MFVASALGHADTRMVEKHYGHLSQSAVADMIRAKLPSFSAPAGDERFRVTREGARVSGKTDAPL